MKYLVLLLSCCLLATAAARAQAPARTTAQLWQAVRQHPQPDRRRVDLLNELADVELRMIEGTGSQAISWPRIDSLTRLAYALARQLRYAQGETYAGFLNIPLILPKRIREAHSFTAAQAWLKQEYLPILERSGNNRLISSALIQLIFSNQSNPDNPRYLRQMLAAAHAAHLPRILCHAYRAQGFYYRTGGDYYQGLQGFSEQLRLAQQMGLADEVADALNSIGNTYTNIADYPQSLSAYQRALTYANRVTPANYRAIVQQVALVGLGYGYQKAGQYAQALAALRHATELGDSTSGQMIHAKVYIAEIYEDQHRPQALAYTRHVLRQARQAYASSCYPELLLTLGRYYLHAGQADSAVANGRRALRFSRNELYKEDEVFVLQLLAQAYALQRNYTQAYTYQSRYLSLHDTLNSEQNTRRITSLQFSQNLARQRAKIV